MVDADSRMIQLRAVSKRYDRQLVVDRVDLGVDAGERVALLGHNGAGKTTLIKLILGLCQPTSGEIVVCGVAAGASRSDTVGIGYLPENVSFYESMSGRELIRFYADLKKRGVAECDALLDRVGLSPAAGRRIRTYSKGMRQRLGLAQALLGAPSLMLLDEPTTGLDPALRGLFYEIIAERAAAGCAMLISSHALTEIEASVDRIAILKDGALVASGTLDELRRQASLSATIRVRVPAGEAGALAATLKGKVGIQNVNEHTVDLDCIDGQKLEVLRHLGELDRQILDVDIAPVRLEQIYAHFTRAQEQRR